MLMEVVAKQPLFPDHGNDLGTRHAASLVPNGMHQFASKFISVPPDLSNQNHSLYAATGSLNNHEA